MQIEIQLTTEPLMPRRDRPESLDRVAGAVVEFFGVVRAEEAGQSIAGLEYEAYQPMAERVMRRSIEEIACRHPCLLVRVRHRLGIVPAGETAFEMLAMARHRAQALGMVEEFMDRLKQDAPIWKRRAVTGEAPPAQEPP
jgi:molybdopterin synthase catalytic subunit